MPPALHLQEGFVRMLVVLPPACCPASVDRRPSFALSQPLSPPPAATLHQPSHQQPRLAHPAALPSSVEALAGARRSKSATAFDRLGRGSPFPSQAVSTSWRGRLLALFPSHSITSVHYSTTMSPAPPPFKQLNVASESSSLGPNGVRRAVADKLPRAR